eukprot:4900713-Amphidinium_carterae.1
MVVSKPIANYLCHTGSSASTLVLGCPLQIGLYVSHTLCHPKICKWGISMQVFPPELVDIVIQRLHEHAEHVEVQQWGLAAFGVLLAADVNLLERSTTGSKKNSDPHNVLLVHISR